MLLAYLTGGQDVLFGATTAGRARQETPGVESMIGLFMNTLPVRVRLNPALSPTRLFTALQEWNTTLLPYQYLGLSEIHQLAGVGALFDTVIVFEALR